MKRDPEQAARLIAAAPDLLEALKEMTAACAAACRVLAGIDTPAPGADLETRFHDEAVRAGVANGFGVRAQAAIKRAEGQ